VPPASAVDEAAAAAAGGGGGEGNVIVQLAVYVKDSVANTVKATGQLWTNHGRCREIRRRQREHRETVRQRWIRQGLYEDETPRQIQERLRSVPGGITYEDFCFLLQGTKDRSRVLTLGLMVWGAPRFLPYAIMMNPDMLPSPFGAHRAAPLDADLSRERTHAILTTLQQMEHALAAGPSFLQRMNFFGQQRLKEQKAALQTVTDTTARLLSEETESRPEISTVLSAAAPVLYKPGEDFTRAEKRLCQVPPCVVRGLSAAVQGKAGQAAGRFPQAPHFLRRGGFVRHLREVRAADDFLAGAGIDLGTIGRSLLLEACRARLLADQAQHLSTDDLRGRLAEWLRLAVHDPAATVQRLGTRHRGKTVYYNDNVGRLVLMAYYGCLAARDASGGSKLPRLLFQAPDDRPSAVTAPSEATEDEKRRRRRRGKD
jgi:hypothetical protein